jgi:hypothetical protein
MSLRARPRRTTTRALLGCGVAAGPVFLGLATVDGATRPDYDPLRHPISSLALGPRGRRQVGNFALSGALAVAGAVGLFAQRPGLVRWGGLFQRTSLAAGLGWFSAVCARTLRTTR